MRHSTSRPRRVMDGAMQWKEIGEALGLSEQHAFNIYRAAIKKLSRDPEQFAKLRDLVAAKQAEHRQFLNRYRGLAVSERY